MGALQGQHLQGAFQEGSPSSHCCTGEASSMCTLRGQTELPSHLTCRLQGLKHGDFLLHKHSQYLLLFGSCDKNTPRKATEGRKEFLLVYGSGRRVHYSRGGSLRSGEAWWQEPGLADHVFIHTQEARGKNWV